MRRLASAVFAPVAVLGLVGVFLSPRPALAQRAPRDSSSDTVKKLEAELEKLRAQVKEVEARLQKAKEGERRPEFGRGRPGRGGWGGWGGPVRGGWGGHGRGRGPGARPLEGTERKPDSTKDDAKKDDRRTDLERRLDRLARELEELRREIRRR
ncbi:MAG TPA: hypothetical protein VKD72_17710 [Gemmataceae bacterium]|nr:hypothetical protein [Gemmataceae bacterium]